MSTPTTVVSSMVLGETLFDTEIREGIERIEDLIRDELGGADPVLSDHVQHLCRAGGTRFRPLFTVLCAQLGPNPRAWQVTISGAVVELVHLATLYHDDVMAAAQVGRGPDSANARWGNNIAILTGDYMFAAASRLVSGLGVDTVRLMADNFAQLVTGQMRETRGADPGVDEIEQYFQVVHEKTASLIATCGRLGATFSGAEPAQIERLSRLGEAIGTAFQLSDDISDITTDAAESGKAPGADLRKGVHTLPVLYALRENSSEATRLRELLHGPMVDDTVGEALILLRGSPGIELAHAAVESLAARARTDLAELSASCGRDALAALIDYSVNRHG